MAEKRTFPRLKKRLIVEFVSEGVFRTGFTRDISHTGLFIASAHLPKMGEPLSITLNLGEGKKISLHGTVVRGRRAPTSLSFSDPTGFCFDLEGYSEEFTRYLSSMHH
jgi:hypothetical protein